MADSTRPSRVRGALPAVAGISLANKSQLLFGLVAALILFFTLAVPWIRGGLLIRAFEDVEARQIAAAWLDGRVTIADEDVLTGPFPPRVNASDRMVDVTVVPLIAAGRGVVVEDAEAAADLVDVAVPGPDIWDDPTRSSADEQPGDLLLDGLAPEEAPPGPAVSAASADAGRFVLEAAAAFRGDPDRAAVVRRYRVDDRTVIRTASPLTHAMLEAIPNRPERLQFGAVVPPGPASSSPSPSPSPPPPPAAPELTEPNRVVAMLVIDRDGGFTESSRLGTQIWILVAGIAGIAASIGAFWLILKGLILSPVRKLRETAEAVQAGDLSRRSQIKTGDEFEQLAGAFNIMLDRLEQGRGELEQINRSLDLKVDELAKANVGLDESNRLKSEFVASVSHELRTPLNSIIGFAELLQELARGESGAETDPKRLRYLENIVGSGRSLLEMINELLDMAKIEAGRMEVSIEPTSVVDVVEGLVKIMGPQATARRVKVATDVAKNLPLVETDPGKLQQILYNFLSNAIKFTPEDGTITVGAERILRTDRTPVVRLWVADSGPGIPADMQDMIFEKFRQADATHTREHAGTGLGLAICRSLAEMLGASVACTSRPGEGATFSVEVPAQWRPEEPPPLMP